MKLYYLLGLLLLGVATGRVLDESIPKLDDNNENKLEDDSNDDRWTIDSKSTAKFAEKCKEIGGEAAVKKFNLAVDKTTTCLNNEVPKTQSQLKKEFDNDGEDESDSICSKKRKTLRNCFVDVIDALKDCSHEEEKYVPDFLFDAIDGILDFVCADNGKVVNDVINANETDECVNHLLEELFSGNLTFVCTENFQLLHHNEDDIVTKRELCSDLYTAKTCYSSVLTRECPKATALYTFLVGTFNAVIAPCKDVPIEAVLPAIHKNVTLGVAL